MQLQDVEGKREERPGQFHRDGGNSRFQEWKDKLMIIIVGEKGPQFWQAPRQFLQYPLRTG